MHLVSLENTGSTNTLHSLVLEPVLCIKTSVSYQLAQWTRFSLLAMRVYHVCTVSLKSKLPPLVSFLARQVSFLSRHCSFLARRVLFLSRIHDAFSMAYITHKKPVMCNDCCSAVHCQIDGAVQHKMCINHLLYSY